MIKDYLDETLDGKKTNDVRSYPTNKRGTIALVDSKTSIVYGYVDIVECREITAEEYSKWHCTGRFAGFQFLCDSNKKYYSYEFKNIRLEKDPFKIRRNGRIWVSW